MTGPLIIPDVSEYQTVDYGTFHGPIIVRAHNGRRADLHWVQHAMGAQEQPWWAAYQYLPADVDAATAAYRFLGVLGDFRPAATILDLEEGEGDQTARQHAWLEVMAGDPSTDWTYSGLYFARAHGVTVDWIAAYGQAEPTDDHRLWQYTNAHLFAGIGRCDASLFHGTVDDLRNLTTGAPDMNQNEHDALARIDERVAGLSTAVAAIQTTVMDPTTGENQALARIDERVAHLTEGGTAELASLTRIEKRLAAITIPAFPTAADIAAALIAQLTTRPQQPTTGH